MEKNDDVEPMGVGGPFQEQNGGSVDGCLPALGGADDGVESDCDLSLDMLSWTSDDGEILEMWDVDSADGDSCGGGGKVVLKEDLELPSINGRGRDNGGNGNDEDGGRASKEDLEMPMPMNGCYHDGGDNIGGGEERVMRKGPWTAAEDALLIKVVEQLGSGDWVAIERYSGLARTSKSCRLRWTNHLRPNLKKGSFSLEEERQVVRMHYKYGNKWSRMARHLPGRTDNEIKNFWHSRVKKCKKQGVPIYPDWCKEEEETLKGVEDYDVDEQPNHISAAPMDNSSTTPLFAARSLPEDQLASSHPPYSHDQESLTRCSNQTNLPNSSLPAKNHLAFTQQPPPSYQTDEIAVLESYPSKAHVSLSYQQPPHISTDDISQDQLSSAFKSATGPSPELQYYSSQGQYFLSGSHNYSSSDEPKPLHCLPISSSSALPQLSLPEKSCSSSAQQPSSKYQPNLSVNNNSYIAFKHFRPPPILSPPSGRFKRLHKPSGQLPPVPKPTQSSVPEKGQSASASAASVSSFHLNASSSVTHSSPELKLPTIESAVPSVQLNKSTLTSPAPGPEMNSSTAAKHSFLRMKVSTQTPPESYGQINSSVTAAPGSSLKRYLPTSELPVSSRQLHSSTPGYSSIGISEPPSIQSSRRDLKPNLEMKRSLMTGKSKSYSDLSDDSLLQETQVEPSLSDLHLVKGYLLSKRLKMKQLYGNILGRRMPQNITSNKGVLLGGSPDRKGFLTRSLSDVMMRKGAETQDLTGNNSYRSFPLNRSSKTVNFSSGKSTKECLSNFGSYGKDLLGRSGGIAVPSDNSRKEALLRKTTKKEGLLSEVSKTGVLLVENTKKENLLRELLKREDSLGLSSQREVSLREGLVPEDSMMIESLDSEKFPSEKSSRESLKRKGPMTESLEKECSMSTSSKRDQSSREVFLGKNLSEGFLNPREQASVAGEFGHLNSTSLPVSNVSTGNLHSAEIPASNRLYSRSESSKRLCLRDESLKRDSLQESSEREGPLAIHGQEYIFDALSPLFKQSTTTTPLRSSDSFRGSTYFQAYKGDHFTESLEGEWSKNLQTECIEDKTLTNQFLGEPMKGEGLLESQDKSHGICQSNLLPCQYAAPGLIKSGHPGAEVSSGRTSTSESLDRCVKLEDSLCKSLEKSNTCNKDVGKELLKESSIEEPALASIESKPSQNGLVPVISQSTTDYMLKSRVQSGKSGSHYRSSGDMEGLIRENSEKKTELTSQQPNLLHNGWDRTKAHMPGSCLQNGESGSTHRSAGKGVQQKPAEEHVNNNTLPEELSSLLQFFATTAREFTGMQFLEQFDMSLGLEPPLLSPPIKINAAAE